MHARHLLLAIVLYGAAMAAAAQPQQAACSALANWTGAEDLRIDEARFYAQRSLAGPGGSQTTLPPHW